MIKIHDMTPHWMSALRALHYLIVSIFHHNDYYTYEVAATDTEVAVKQTSVFRDKHTVTVTGDTDEMQKIVLAARIIGNKTRENKNPFRRPSDAEWYEFRLNTLLQVLNITKYEWRCSGLKLGDHDLPLMLEFAAKFPEMKFGDVVDAGRRFYKALDERLMELCTRVGGEMFFTVEEYETWKYTKSLRHVGEVRPVRDVVAASIQDAFVNRTMEIVDTVYGLLGMPRPGDARWDRGPA